METIVSLIRDSVSINSERRALAAQRGYRTEIWTYRHLWEFSGRVSTYLRDQGIESGDRIALKAPNSPRWVAAYLGCLRLGAIVVPLDVRSSEEGVLPGILWFIPAIVLLGLIFVIFVYFRTRRQPDTLA